VTLCIGVPLLGFTTAAMRRGSLRARLLWLGALGYMVYAYGMYAISVRWNQLFLVYVALFGLSFFAVIIGLVGTDAERVRGGVAGRPAVRPVAIYLIVIAVIVAALWLADEARALLSGTVPPSVVLFESPTNIVHVFDLALVLPALLLAAVMLFRDRSWGCDSSQDAGREGGDDRPVGGGDLVRCPPWPAPGWFFVLLSRRGRAGCVVPRRARPSAGVRVSGGQKWQPSPDRSR
jgi:hypothetical protein